MAEKGSQIAGGRKVGTVMTQRAQNAGTITPTPETPRCGRSAIQSSGRLFLWSLTVAYLAFLVAIGFGVAMATRSVPHTHVADSGLRPIPAECWEADDFYSCANYLEPQ